MAKDFIKHNVIIVGGSIAGLTCARELTKLGVDKILVIDKKHTIGVPVRCAEAIMDSTLFDNNIVPECVFIARTCNSATINYKNISYELNLKHYKIYMLERDLFEQYLMLDCENTEFIMGERVKKLIGLNTIKTDKAEYQGKVIVDASGIEARIGRQLGIVKPLLRTDISVCYQYLMANIDINPWQLELHFFPRGYIWVFPKGISDANVGAGTISGIPAPKAVLDKFIKKRFRAGYEILNEFRKPLPSAVMPERPYKHNVLCIGDAVRATIPTSGGGIASGMYTAKTAANAIHRYLEGDPEGLMNYQINLIDLRNRLIKSYRTRNKLLNEKNLDRFMFHTLKWFLKLHRIFPRFCEKYGLKKLRY